MSKSTNMLSILWLLKSGKRMTAREIAEALEINIRTVYRYIDSLCTSGVPIIADSGHNGGYSLLRDFNEAPLYFDLEEQKALNHAAIFAQESGYPFNEELQRAVSKLNRYTNEEQIGQINRHISGFDVIQPPTNPLLDCFLQALELAVADGKTLQMQYQKGEADTRSKRQIDPYGLVLWKNRWYIVAYCHFRGEVRSFRVDRIISLDKTESTFERPTDFSARQFFLKSLLPDLDSSAHLISVRIASKPQVIKELSSHWLLWPSLVEQTETEIHFKVKEETVYHYLPYSLLAYGKAINIIEPAPLRHRLIEITSDLLQHYQKISHD